LRKRVGELEAVKPREEKRQANSERSKAAHARAKAKRETAP
jgi:hypothetical protein